MLQVVPEREVPRPQQRREAIDEESTGYGEVNERLEQLAGVIGELAEEAHQTRNLSEGIYYYLANGGRDRRQPTTPVNRELNNAQRAINATQSYRPRRSTTDDQRLEGLQRFVVTAADREQNNPAGPSQNGSAGSNVANAVRGEEIVHRGRLV
jgi:hypothetical protein